VTRPAHILFDLDGTLVDSAPLCADVVNDMLRDRGSQRVVTAIEARAFMTRGGIDTVSSLLAVDCGELESELADFRIRYSARPTPEDCLYSGVRDGLEQLASLGIALGVCSNKPQHLCEKIIEDLGLGNSIVSVVGSRPGHALKPAGDLIQLSMEELGASPDRCLLVGDSEVDFLTARSAGVPFLFVSYGYANPNWHMDGIAKIDRFEELVEHILSRELTRAA
jgi:phosphoglycolate phosphatase